MNMAFDGIMHTPVVERVVLQTPTSCCCGHGPEMHLGGPDLSADELKAHHLAHPGGDGGMCRSAVGTKRCDCFSFCDCHLTRYERREEGLK
jgi:hypothetical protein